MTPMDHERIEATKQREKAYFERLREGGFLSDFSVQRFRSKYLGAY